MRFHTLNDKWQKLNLHFFPFRYFYLLLRLSVSLSPPLSLLPRKRSGFHSTNNEHVMNWSLWDEVKDNGCEWKCRCEHSFRFNPKSSCVRISDHFIQSTTIYMANAFDVCYSYQTCFGRKCRHDRRIIRTIWICWC